MPQSSRAVQADKQEQGTGLSHQEQCEALICSKLKNQINQTGPTMQIFQPTTAAVQYLWAGYTGAQPLSAAPQWCHSIVSKALMGFMLWVTASLSKH